MERRCSECPASLAGRKAQTKTCSSKCRSERSRRLARANTDEGQSRLAEIAHIVRGEAPEIAHRVVQEELRPIVREALTEDVLRSLQRMVGLTPLMVDAIEEDLASEDATIRQRAYSLVMKYTVGHPAVVRPEESNAGQQLVVNFQLPRPGEAAVPGSIRDEPVDAESTELVPCDACGEDKLASEFVSGSTRCQECFDKRAAEVKALYPDV
jgi:hypothetical protein